MCVSALPYVRQYDRPKNVIEGDPFQTECYAWGYPPVTVIWHRSNETVDAEASRVMLKNGSAENSTLRIEDVCYDDSDDYTCVATNALGSVSATISLRVKGAEFAEFVILLVNKHCHMACQVVDFISLLKLYGASETDNTDVTGSNNSLIREQFSETHSAVHMYDDRP